MGYQGRANTELTIIQINIKFVNCYKCHNLKNELWKGEIGGGGRDGILLKKHTLADLVFKY